MECSEITDLLFAGTNAGCRALRKLLRSEQPPKRRRKVVPICRRDIDTPRFWRLNLAK
jgi:hypothetical protein